MARECFDFEKLFRNLGRPGRTAESWESFPLILQNLLEISWRETDCMIASRTGALWAKRGERGSFARSVLLGS